MFVGGVGMASGGHQVDVETVVPPGVAMDDLLDRPPVLQIFDVTRDLRQVGCRHPCSPLSRTPVI